MFEEQKPKPELSVGEARKLNELTSEKWREHLLLFSQVKNKVLFTNDEIYFPLKLKKGEPSPLGLFAEMAFKEKPDELPKGKQALEFWPQHGRSALLGRLNFADKDGNLYRDIDLKGIGYLSLDDKKMPFVAKPWKKESSATTYGLLGEDLAFFDYKIGEEFLKIGVRANRVIAIIKLEEIIVEGKKLSLDEAEEEGIIDNDFHPVIEVRAFSTKNRVADFYFDPDKKSAQLILEDAMKIVSHELGREKIISPKEYLEWFAETLGRNIGLIHKNGWLHGWISGHNITLDCKMVDLSSVNPLKNSFDRDEEFSAAKNDIKVFSREVLLSFGPDKEPFSYINNELVTIFQKSYDATFPLEERRKYFERIEKGQV